MEHKRIIICFDGTWNEPERLDSEHREYSTNVLKMVRAIKPVDPVSGMQQEVYYQPGIGTGGIGFLIRRLTRLLGGLTGMGISRNIQDAYRFLANNYSEGDEIYLFGFSRGAYTARSFAGMIGSIGLMRKSDMDLLPKVYDYYRTPPHKRSLSKHFDMVAGLKRSFPKIQFLGVWDTVGALGLPVPGLQHLSRRWVRFHDTHLGPHVLNAYHAVAIDERRRPFKPAMWTQLEGQLDCQQVWFSGVHSNVGGGYADHGLSDTALMWLVNRARDLGLAYDQDYIHDQKRIAPSIKGKLEDSFTWPYKLLRLLGVMAYRRPIGAPDSQNEMIHESVIARVLEDPDYRPLNLFPVEPGMYPLVSYIHNRNVIQVGDKEIPVYRERQSDRLQQQDCPATLIDNKGEELGCDILDHSEGGGARLKLVHPPSPGTAAYLNSRKFGRRKVTVVWSNGDEAGVKYAA
jgi:hypothetical protein